jgi:hypothetical protein
MIGDPMHRKDTQGEVRNVTRGGITAAGKLDR